MVSGTSHVLYGPSAEEKKSPANAIAKIATKIAAIGRS
jgi:hypothetical protein